MNEPPSRPDREFRVGAVRAAAWINNRRAADGRSFRSFKVVVERTYKDSQSGFQTTHSLDLNDIPKAILALSKIYELLATDTTSASAPTGIERQAQFQPAARIP